METLNMSSNVLSTFCKRTDVSICSKLFTPNPNKLQMNEDVPRIEKGKENCRRERNAARRKKYVGLGELPKFHEFSLCFFLSFPSLSSGFRCSPFLALSVSAGSHSHMIYKSVFGSFERNHYRRIVDPCIKTYVSTKPRETENESINSIVDIADASASETGSYLSHKFGFYANSPNCCQTHFFPCHIICIHDTLSHSPTQCQLISH